MCGKSCEPATARSSDRLDSLASMRLACVLLVHPNSCVRLFRGSNVEEQSRAVDAALGPLNAFSRFSLLEQGPQAVRPTAKMTSIQVRCFDRLLCCGAVGCVHVCGRCGREESERVYFGIDSPYLP